MYCSPTWNCPDAVCLRLDSGKGWVYNKVSAEWESLCRHRSPAVFGYTLVTGFFPRRFVIGAAGEDVGWSYGDVFETQSVWKRFLSICFEFWRRKVSRVCSGKPKTDRIKGSLFAMQNSRRPMELFGSPAFSFCSEKNGTQKRRTEEVPRRSAASPRMGKRTSKEH